MDTSGLALWVCLLGTNLHIKLDEGSSHSKRALNRLGRLYTLKKSACFEIYGMQSLRGLAFWGVKIVYSWNLPKRKRIHNGQSLGAFQ